MIFPMATSVMREVFAAGAGRREGGRARPRRHPLGGGAHGRAAVRPQRHHRRHACSPSAARSARPSRWCWSSRQAFEIKPYVLESGTSTISSLIASSFKEATPAQLSALLTAGFVLFCMTLVVNSLAARHRLALARRRGDRAVTQTARAPRRRRRRRRGRRADAGRRSSRRCCAAPARRTREDVLALVGAAVGVARDDLALLHADPPVRGRDRLRRRAGTSSSSRFYAGLTALTQPRPVVVDRIVTTAVIAAPDAGRRRAGQRRRDDAGQGPARRWRTSTSSPRTCPASGPTTRSPGRHPARDRRHPDRGRDRGRDRDAARRRDRGLHVRGRRPRRAAGAHGRRGDDRAAVDRGRPVHLHGLHRLPRHAGQRPRGRAGAGRDGAADHGAGQRTSCSASCPAACARRRTRSAPARWQTVWKVVLPTARPGLATALILGIARAVGETSPVLLTSGASTFFNTNPIQDPMNSLPLFIYAAVQSGSPQMEERGVRRRRGPARRRAHPVRRSPGSSPAEGSPDDRSPGPGCSGSSPIAAGAARRRARRSRRARAPRRRTP